MINWGLLQYLWVSYTRSSRYFAPMAFMVILLFILYSYKPNPVMDSYAVTSMLLFIGFAWLGMNFLNHDQGRQSVLLILHTGSARTFYATQYVVLVMMGIVLSVVSVAYPILTGMFVETVGVGRFILAMMSHLSMALLGAGIALYFQSGWIENQGRAVGLLLILIVVSIAGLSLGDSLPYGFRIVAYILPPASMIIDMLMHTHERSVISSVLTILYTFAYTVGLLIIYIKLACTKDAAELIRKSG